METKETKETTTKKAKAEAPQADVKDEAKVEAEGVRPIGTTGKLTVKGA